MKVMNRFGYKKNLNKINYKYKFNKSKGLSWIFY
jgi:hypothetical protein